MTVHQSAVSVVDLDSAFLRLRQEAEQLVHSANERLIDNPDASGLFCHQVDLVRRQLGLLACDRAAKRLQVLAFCIERQFERAAPGQIDLNNALRAIDKTHQWILDGESKENRHV